MKQVLHYSAVLETVSRIAGFICTISYLVYMALMFYYIS